MKINLKNMGSRAKVAAKNALGNERINANVRRLFLLIAFLLILNALLGRTFQLIIVFSIFVAVGALSTFYYNFFHGPINFELVKFTTVLSAVAYGTWAGILVGILGTIAGRVLSGRLDQRTFLSILGIVLMAILADVFSNFPIVLLGVSLVVLYQLIISPLSVLMGDEWPFVAIYAMSNVAFNIFFFAYFAKIILSLII